MCANSDGSGRLRECAGSSEPSLVAYMISTIISWADSFGESFPCFSVETYVVGTQPIRLTEILETDSNEYPQYVLWRTVDNYPSIIIKYQPFSGDCILYERFFVVVFYCMKLYNSTLGLCPHSVL